MVPSKFTSSAGDSALSLRWLEGSVQNLSSTGMSMTPYTTINVPFLLLKYYIKTNKITGSGIHNRQRRQSTRNIVKIDIYLIRMNVQSLPDYPTSCIIRCRLYIFWSFGIILSQFENIVPLKPVLWGVGQFSSIT